MAMVQISENRLKSLLAAEAYCQAARCDIVDFGLVTRRAWPWFDQWMRHTGNRRYLHPKAVSPT